MPRSATSYTELAQRVVRESPEPLPFAKIVEGVEALAPITTNNPKQTIRNAITSSHMLLATGDGRYGWKPHLLSGALLRLPLDAAALAGGLLAYSDEVRDALYPAFFGPQAYNDRSPVAVDLPDGTATELTLNHAGGSEWSSHISPELKNWLDRSAAQAGDDLLLEVLDGEARHYRFALQRRIERDEAAIAERNAQAVEQTLAIALVGRRNNPLFLVVSQLLARGFYRHPVPPDPLHTLLALDGYGIVLGDRAVLSGLEDEHAAAPIGIGEMGVPLSPDLLVRVQQSLQQVGGDPSRLPPEVFAELQQLLSARVPVIVDRNALPRSEPDDLDALPPEYAPGPGRRRRPSAAAARGPAPVVTLRVSHQARPKVWRDIAIAEDQTLEDLHLAIQEAYGWADDHLYSFFMSGRPYDSRTEVGSPFSEAAYFTHRITIGSLKLAPGRRFLYLFDYGDDHEFTVEVRTRDEAAPMGDYPRVVGTHGRAPSQYGRWQS